MLGAKEEDYTFFLENAISTAVLYNYVKAAIPTKAPTSVKQAIDEREQE